MPNKTQPITVDEREILFFKENQPTAFPRLIAESLAAKGIKATKRGVRLELSTLKKAYNPVIINEARRLLETIKGVKYTAK